MAVAMPGSSTPRCSIAAVAADVRTVDGQRLVDGRRGDHVVAGDASTDGAVDVHRA